ncbi:helix-turn-helix domain-containing protein [Paraburkholderia ultramafica]|uniref:helix-turn-helix domain-containing protein n=1 Tax=Paraburkholderia ultramafica TaxID=1544867 RepID=UPI001581D523|nr:helix-turn-helix transcriptional regulator [Paraburkholderia ultramafica]
MPHTPQKPKRPAARSVLAANLRRLRAINALSQYDLADRSGVDRSFIAHVEREARNVSIDTIDKLAFALQVPIAELFTEM